MTDGPIGFVEKHRSFPIGTFVTIAVKRFEVDFMRSSQSFYMDSGSQMHRGLRCPLKCCSNVGVMVLHCLHKLC